MSRLEEIKIELKGIAEILKDRNSYVPKYQRSYAWKDENVQDLYYDIANAINNGAKEYFLGSAVISQRIEDKPEIVDGQQRLATVCILIAAIRDYFFQLGTHEGKERAEMISSDYLAKKNLDTLELIPKLHLNDADNDFFVKKVLSAPDNDDRNIKASKSSHERIEQAKSIAEGFVKRLVVVTGDPTKLMIQWINYLANKAKVIIVRVPDESNAFTIFETLNDRGLALAVSDLLKNYLFYKSEDRISEVQYQWIQMLSIIEDAENEQAVINFIRHFWSSKNGLVREKELFDRIKQSVTSKNEAISLAKGLYAASTVYSAIATCEENYWSKYSSPTKLHMETLNLFGMVQIRPLLLAMLNHFSLHEAEKGMKYLVNCSTRLLIVGGLGSGALESKYCEAASKISKSEIVNVKQLLDFLQNILPNDSEFSRAYANATVSKPALARYYLRTLESIKRKDPEPELIPNKDSDTITLEHILPQVLSNDWKHIGMDDAKASYRRLGNLTLLKKTPNSNLGNKGFSEKKPIYMNSEFLLTKEIGDFSIWDMGAIQSRQEKMAELALKAWPVKL